MATDRTTIVHVPLLASDSRYAAVDSPDEPVSQARHQHPCDEDIIVLEGWLDVRLPQRQAHIRVEAGQRVTVPAGVPHEIRAQGLFESFLRADTGWPPVAAGEGAAS